MFFRKSDVTYLQTGGKFFPRSATNMINTTSSLSSHTSHNSEILQAIKKITPQFMKLMSPCLVSKIISSSHRRAGPIAWQCSNRHDLLQGNDHVARLPEDLANKNKGELIGAYHIILYKKREHKCTIYHNFYLTAS